MDGRQFQSAEVQPTESADVIDFDQLYRLSLHVMEYKSFNTFKSKAHFHSNVFVFSIVSQCFSPKIYQNFIRQHPLSINQISIKPPMHYETV